MRQTIRGVRLKHLLRITKPDGRTYWYFRVKGQKTISLPDPSDLAFPSAYAAAWHRGGGRCWGERKKLPIKLDGAAMVAYIQGNRGRRTDGKMD
jgi:hypothetical protein